MQLIFVFSNQAEGRTYDDANDSVLEIQDPDPLNQV